MADTPRARARVRLLSVGVLVAALVASGVGLERLASVRPPAESSVDGEPTGAWFCPHGGSNGWRGWVVLANPGDRPVRVRVTTLAEGGVQGVSWITVGALRHVYREIPAAEASAATTLEYFGGWVGAAAVLQADRARGAGAAERCVSGSRPLWFLLDQPTGRGETGYVVVMNPFAVDAQFDVVIRTEQRTIQPSSLTPYVLPRHSSVAIKLNEFALEAPGEGTVTAEVIRRTGRIVAGGVGISPEGVRAEVGAAVLDSTWTVPAPGVRGESRLAVLNPADGTVDLSLVSVERDGQRVLSGAEAVSVGGQSAASYPVPEVEHGGIVVEASGDHGVAPGLVLAGRRSDSAAIGLAPGSEVRWLVLASTPPQGGRQILLVQNAGEEDATLSVRLLGDRGPVRAPSTLSLPAGRSLEIEVSQFSRGRPVSVVVQALTGKVVAGGGSYAAEGVGYAATLGLPMPSPD